MVFLLLKMQQITREKNEDKKVISAVCFSPERQNQTKMLSQIRSPVKVENFQLQNEDSGPDGDIFITKYTKIAPIQKDVNFTFSDELIVHEMLCYHP